MAVATEKTPQALSIDGVEPAAFTPSQVEGHFFANNGATFLLVTNDSNAAITVTIVSQLTVGGLAVADQAVTVDAGATMLIGPFDPKIFNDEDGQTTVTFSAITSVALSILSLGI